MTVTQITRARTISIRHGYDYDERLWPTASYTNTIERFALPSKTMAERRRTEFYVAFHGGELAQRREAVT